MAKIPTQAARTVTRAEISEENRRIAEARSELLKELAELITPAMESVAGGGER